MKLKIHRRDVKHLRYMQNTDIAKRYYQLIIWAEAVLEENKGKYVEMEIRGRRVVEDAK